MTDTGIKKERESNYELLRMLAGMAVIILHFNYFPGGGGALANATGATYYVLLFLEALCACAVNIFILLSGYFSCYSKKIKTGRLLEILLQTICLSLAVNVVSSIIHNSWSITQLAGSLIPANYYVILYIALMFLAPFINKLTDSLGKRGFNILMIIAFLLFSVYAFAVDILKEISGSAWAGLSTVGIDGSMNGYTIVNFVLVYLLGSWLRKNEGLKNIKTSILLVILIACAAAIMGWRRFLPETAWPYHSPLIILEACVIFTLFGRIKISSRVINTIAPAAFTCFLIHGTILGLLNDRISAISTLPQALLYMLAIVLGVFLISFIVMKIWEMLVNAVKKAIKKELPDIQVE